MRFLFLLLFISLSLFVPMEGFAQEYKPLVQVPVESGDTGGFGGYINTLYVWSIGIAGLLAVLKIIVAGVKYMTTDIVSTKGDAKKDIQSALLGLLLVAGAVLILTEINPNLLNLNFGDRIEPAVEVNTGGGAGLFGGGTATTTTDAEGNEVTIEDFGEVPLNLRYIEINSSVAECVGNGGVPNINHETGVVTCTISTNTGAAAGEARTNTTTSSNGSQSSSGVCPSTNTVERGSERIITADFSGCSNIVSEEFDNSSELSYQIRQFMTGCRAGGGRDSGSGNTRTCTIPL